MTNDDKSNSLTADQNELPEPASPGDVSGANPRQAGCTEQEEKAESLPDLIRLFKNRARDGDIIKKCKIMLVAGVPPGRCALLLRLPLERVMELFNASYNPRCRRFANPDNGRLVMTMWNESATIAEICQSLGLPLFTVCATLRQSGITDAAMAPRMPPYDDPLCVEYRQVVARKAASKFKPIHINPTRRSRRADVGKSAGRTATA
ncbi:hypothetical protein A9493_12345 [Klebsiella pneumoniae]|nr:hypothetical protein [Klebsiella pneumoniae]AUC28192.1 hypothetical protein A9493_12345 [Klebsiella pneumoniae]MCP5654422.1 hypothetical protein [Klebsiella pneumoniae]OUY33269.1 hypothetical protein BLK92_29910 [Klebsiella pneumoniae]